MTDFVQEFQDTLILRQGRLDSLVFDPPKISLHFIFPKLFELHFNKIEDYRIELPVSFVTTIRTWSATTQSEFLDALPEKSFRHGLSPRDDLSRLCHFHISFQEGYLDVLAEDYVFMMVS